MHHVSRTALVLVALLIVAPVTPVAGQDVPWSGPYTPVQGKPTLGSYLEVEFHDVLQKCALDNFYGTVKGRFFSSVKPLSAVHSILQDDFTLDKPTFVDAQYQQSGASLFAYVLTGDTLRNQSFDQSGYLTADLVADPQTFFQKGWGTIVYKHNCASIVTAAANASANMQLPWAATKAALSNQFSGNQIQQSNSSPEDLIHRLELCCCRAMLPTSCLPTSSSGDGT